MPRSRRNHPPSLKAKVAVEAIKGHKTTVQIAQMFGVHPTLDHPSQRRPRVQIDEAAIPEALVPLQQQFQQFRATHPPRSKLPDEFWASATELAKQHGLYTVAHALRLDYVGLRKRVAGCVRRRRKPARPRFVELVAPNSPKLDE